MNIQLAMHNVGGAYNKWFQSTDIKQVMLELSTVKV